MPEAGWGSRATYGLVLSAVLCFSGCASTGQLGINALNAGNLVAAQIHFERAIQEGDTSSWNNLGVVYQRSGRMEMAVSAYTLGARYGDPVAQQNLVLLGKPVPPVDLASTRQAGEGGGGGGLALAAALAAALADGYVEGSERGRESVSPRPAPQAAPAKTKCVSRFNEFSKQLETVCK